MILGSLGFLRAQKSQPIVVEHADFSDVNQTELPDALLLRGNVRVSHDGAVLTCHKAYFFQKENYIKAFGEVQLVQGDTLSMNSKYAEYNGVVKQAFATGNVIMRSPESTLVTDTIHFDRAIQEAYYNSTGIITNKENTLRSKAGRYYAKEKKFRFLKKVSLTNPTYLIETNHLDYYTQPGHAYLLGPSTIKSKENFIYTEKGFYDTRKNKAHFLANSYIKYNDRKIEGDSLYYDRKREYASATWHVKITDTVNKGVLKSHRAEIYRNLKTQNDSIIVTRRAMVATLVDKDTLFMHGKKMIITGKPYQRVVRAFPNVRFYKLDMSGKCDSIHSDQQKALTQLIGHPILWNYKNQLTGDVMHLIGNNKTEKLDSLKVLNNTFIISKDTVGSGFNQVKGVNLFGKFIDNKLHDATVIKNTEVIYFMRNDAQELIGINKSVCSKIRLVFDKNTIHSIRFIEKTDGDLFPEAEFPENARKLRGFIWREDERIECKEDIFPPDEAHWEAEANLVAATLLLNSKEPLKVRKETVDGNRALTVKKDKDKPVSTDQKPIKKKV
ncbi:MAG: OstA-like protein [Flavobacterium sp. BFFFF2]|nr:MAG: OstA-like protein [Flavobacterium sp. BFFFF2]